MSALTIHLRGYDVPQRPPCMLPAAVYLPSTPFEYALITCPVCRARMEVPMLSTGGATRVVHCKREKYDVYIGRPGPWGNPFRLTDDTPAGRGLAILKYETWLRAQPKLMERARRELRGKVLGCWCHPKACHGDVLARIANEEPGAETKEGGNG